MNSRRIDPERTAIAEDAQKRIVELRTTARALMPDRDDPAVLSELHSVLGQIRSAEQAFREATS